jgi:putative alpha-1,2-mannosidase
LEKHYRNAPDGIPGNDDTGTMSAWAVFSMIGFYPDCPGDPSYTLTLPVFDRVDLTLPGGNTLTITKSPKAKPARKTSARIGKKHVTDYRIPHDVLVNAGTISWQ